MTLREAYQQLSFRLREIYDEREASSIADLVIEYLSGQKKIERVLNRRKLLTIKEEQLLLAYTEALLQHKPVQYVLGEAWFAGMKFYVDENVLIPRPETEELVAWIVSDLQFTTHNSQFTILDIGTGSGCIAISLKRKLPLAEVHAFDISETALEIARQNALSNETEIKFFKADALDDKDIKGLPGFDIIVSNPPYIKRSEAEEMRTNVFLYEPHAALFVPDEDPLLFYSHIACFSRAHLQQNGVLYVEVNEMFANEVAGLLQSKNFTSVEIRKDLQGKDRMIRATA